MLKKISGFLIMFIFTFNTIAQEDTLRGDLLMDDELPDEFKPSKSTIYFAGQYFNAGRRFEDLSLSKQYDSLSVQESVFTGGFEAGVHIDLSKNFYLSVGANFFGGGESWQFTDSLSDSTFMYTNKYRQIAVPIRLNVEFGKTLKGYGFVGVIPSSILTRRFESSFTDSEGNLTENDVENSEVDINSFQFIGSIGGGLSYSFGETTVFAQVEYRQHFTNTYTGLFLDHTQNLLGGSVGLAFSF